MRKVLRIKQVACSLIVSSVLAATAFLLPATVCTAYQSSAVESSQQYLPATQALVEMVAKDQNLKTLLEKSISEAAKINPDPQTNPAQNLKAYFDYVNWAERAMPWAILPGVEKNHPKPITKSTKALTIFTLSTTGL